MGTMLSQHFLASRCIRHKKCVDNNNSFYLFYFCLVLVLVLLISVPYNDRGLNRHDYHYYYVQGFSSSLVAVPLTRSGVTIVTTSSFNPTRTNNNNHRVYYPHPRTTQQQQQVISSRLLSASSSIVAPPLEPDVDASSSSDHHIEDDTRQHVAKVALPVNNKHSRNHSSNKKKSNVGERVIKLCVDYGKRLWRETSVSQRQRVAKDHAIQSIEKVQKLVDDKGLGGAYWNVVECDEESIHAKQEMALACEKMLRVLKRELKDEHEGTNDKMETVLESSPHSSLVVDSTQYSQQHDDSEQSSPTAPLSQQQHQQNRNGNTVVGTATATATAAPAIIKPVETSDGTRDIKEETATAVVATSIPAATTTTTDAIKPKKKKKQRRSILFGATMGALAAVWVFSGNVIFTSLFTLVTILGQLEYYRMVMSTGVYPARRINVLGACAMFVTALVAPRLHQLCLPTFATWAMIWFLTMRRSASTISEIATTFTGMFYLGYMPSFWVRTRLIHYTNWPTRLQPVSESIFRWIRTTLTTCIPSLMTYDWNRMSILQNYVPITTGATFIFWTWLCIAFSDVGGYFVGRSLGKTKLGAISPAAGVTSPNKTVEGVIGGCAVSMFLATMGSFVQNWPHWYLSGPLHGLMLALLGLVGDLTASMLKRDAGMKDFGDLIPEHGGIMDRVDSYIFSAPYSFLVLTEVLPRLR